MQLLKSTQFYRLDSLGTLEANYAQIQTAVSSLTLTNALLWINNQGATFDWNGTPGNVRSIKNNDFGNIINDLLITGASIDGVMSGSPPLEITGATLSYRVWLKDPPAYTEVALPLTNTVDSTSTFSRSDLSINLKDQATSAGAYTMEFIWTINTKSEPFTVTSSATFTVGGADVSTYTTTGCTCQFPFTWNDKTYYQCVETPTASAFCATWGTCGTQDPKFGYYTDTCTRTPCPDSLNATYGDSLFGCYRSSDTLWTTTQKGPGWYSTKTYINAYSGNVLLGFSHMPTSTSGQFAIDAIRISHWTVAVDNSTKILSEEYFNSTAEWFSVWGGQILAGADKIWIIANKTTTSGTGPGDTNGVPGGELSNFAYTPSVGKYFLLLKRINLDKIQASRSIEFYFSAYGTGIDKPKLQILYNVNLCQINNGDCSAQRSCGIQDGNIVCGACPSGYVTNGPTACADFNECAAGGYCSPLANCTNLMGSWSCGPCPFGYTGTGNTTCTLINNCLSNPCDPRTTCQSFIGGFNCTACPNGFSGTGVAGCSDINECNNVTNSVCSSLSTCNNTIGSYQCLGCASGYSGTGYGASGCVDINECASTPTPCVTLSGASNTVCVNTVGSYLCGPTIVSGSTNVVGYPAGYVTFPDTLSTGVVNVNVRRGHPSISFIMGYGPASKPFQYLCSNNPQQAVTFTPFTTQSFQCSISAGVSANMSIQLQLRSSVAGSINGTNIFDLSGPWFGFPKPTISSQTIRFAATAPNFDPPSTASVVALLDSFTARISFSGTNFGDSNQVSNGLIRIGYGVAGAETYLCTPVASGWTSTHAVCDTQSAGVGTNLQLTVTIGNQIVKGDGNNAISYPSNSPVITSLNGCQQRSVGSVDIVNCNPAGDDIITINGYNFGTTTSAVLVKGQFVPILSSNATTIKIRLLPEVGEKVPIIISCWNPPVYSSVSWLSFASPTIERVEGCSEDPISPTTINDCNRKTANLITIFGTNFGEKPALISVGSSFCLNSIVGPTLSTQTSLICELQPGSGKNLPLMVMQVNGLSSSVLPSVSYEQCPIGTVLDDNLDCSACTGGTYLPLLGMESCLTCTPGRYSVNSTTSSHECLICPPGFWSLEGAWQCEACNPGFYQDSPGQSGCYECPMGTFSSEYNASVCTACSAGSYQDKNAKQTCTQCSAGRYSVAGAATCQVCEAGRFSNVSVLGAAICSLCPPGFAQNMSDQMFCFECDLGTYASEAGSTTCLSCPVGKYRSGPPATMCSDCPLGTYQNSPMASGCVHCAPGYFSASTSQSTCQECQPGSYQNDYGSTNCKPCTAGFSQQNSAQSNCTACESGSYSESSGNVRCSLCPTGKYTTALQSTFCFDCQPGFYQNFVGETTCRSCIPGFYSQEPSRALCAPCDAGKYSLASNSSTCLECPPGSFQSNQSSQYCLPCTPGTSNAAHAQTLCVPCAAGYYMNDTGAYYCEACEPGFYSDQVNETRPTSCRGCQPGTFAQFPASIVCQSCPVGKFSNVSDSTECEDCPDGMFQDLIGQTFCSPCSIGQYPSPSKKSCSLCEPGFYSAMNQSTSCTACPGGTYQNETGQSTCTVCQPGRFSVGGAAVCDLCGKDLIAPNANSSACIPCTNPLTIASRGEDCYCPVGTYKTGGVLPKILCGSCPKGSLCDGIGYNMSTLVTKPGYYRAGNDFLACLQPSHCAGGIAASSVGDAQCAAHREGPLCAVCETGYRTQFGSSDCEPCPSRNAAVGYSVLFFIIIVLCLVFIFWLVLRSDRSTDLLHAELGIPTRPRAMQRASACGAPSSQKLEAEFLHMDPALAGSVVLSPEKRVGATFTYNLKILLGFFQVATSLLSIVDIPWPSYFLSFISLFSFVNLDFIPWSSVSCVGQFDWYTKFFIVTLSPFVVLFALFIIYIIPIWLLERFDYTDNELRRYRRRKAMSDFSKLVLFTLFLLYPGVSSKVLQYFLCREVEGVHYLVADFSVHCYDSRWNHYLGAAIIMIFIYPVGVPTFTLGILTYYRSQLRESAVVRQSLGFIYEAYTHQLWWFEIVDMLVKLFLTSILVFFPTEARLSVGLVVVGGYIGLVLRANPFVRKMDDRLLILTQIEIFLILLCGQILYSDSGSLDNISNVLLSMLLIAIVVVILLLFVLHIGKMIRSKYLAYLRKKVFGKYYEEEASRMMSESIINGERAEERQSIDTQASVTNFLDTDSPEGDLPRPSGSPVSPPSTSDGIPGEQETYTL